MQITITLHCPNCQGTKVVKNGNKKNKKQNYLCKTCKRRFIGDHNLRQFGIRKRYKKLVILQVFRIFIAENQINTRMQAMITNNKIIETFCGIDEFCKNFDAEIG